MTSILAELDKQDSLEYKFEYNGNGDTRIFLSRDNFDIFVHAPTLGEGSYNEMEQEIADFRIKGLYHEVYVWNDISGWDYWNNEGNEHYGNSNYIMVTLNIDMEAVETLAKGNTSKLDYGLMYKDMITAYNKFSDYHNLESVDFSNYR